MVFLNVEDGVSEFKKKAGALLAAFFKLAFKHMNFAKICVSDILARFLLGTLEGERRLVNSRCSTPFLLKT